MSSRTLFAAGGFIAAFLMGVLLVASLACEGGDPTSSGPGVTGDCSAFLGAYIIASLDGAVSKQVVSVPAPVTDADGAQNFTPATTRVSADLVTLAFELENMPGNNTNCSKVNLIAPDGVTFVTAIDFVASAFSPNSLETFDVTAFYNTHGNGAYSIEVFTNTTSCPGTTTTLSNAWLNVVDNTTGGPCCDCYLDDECSPSPNDPPPPDGCCWGHGDWDMWVTLDPSGTIGSTQVDVLIQLNSDPWFGLPGDAVYIFSGTLTCADGSFSATDSALCATISGTIDPAGGSSGILRILDDPCDAVQTEICSSDWGDIPWDLAVCSLGSDATYPIRCFLCEPLTGGLLSSSPGAPASPQLRESPVLQRLRMGR